MIFNFDKIGQIKSRSAADALKPENNVDKSVRSMPEDFRLSKNVPIIDAVLPQALLDSGMMSTDERNGAVDTIRRIHEKYPDFIKSLKDKSLEDARSALTPYVKEIEEEDRKGEGVNRVA